MTVYFQPADKYNINYYAPLLLAQAGAKLIGDEFNAMRARAANAREVQAGRDIYGAMAQDASIADPQVRVMLALKAKDNYWKMSPEMRKDLDSAMFIDNALRSTNIADNTYAGNINAAGGTTESPQSQSVVGAGLTPGSNRVGAANLWYTKAGVDPNNIKQITGILAPENEQKITNLGDRTVVTVGNKYTPEVTQVKYWNNGMAPGTKETLENEWKKAVLAADVSRENARTHAGATVAAANAGQGVLKLERALNTQAGLIQEEQKILSDMLDTKSPAYKNLKEKLDRDIAIYEQMQAPFIPGGNIKNATTPPQPVKKENKNTYKPGGNDTHLKKAEAEYRKKK